jgi:hypothetical protein
VLEALRDPDCDPSRAWLDLLDDEQYPHVVRFTSATLVWSSLWIKRPDATGAFDLHSSKDGGTDLEWTLRVDEPVPDDALVAHVRKRLNQLINANLRHAFGQ